jgi:hypothetical protein
MKFNSIVTTFCLLAIALSASTVCAAEAPAIQVRVRVSDTNGGREKVLASPSMTVRQGQAASVAFITDGKTYSLDILVSPQNGNLVVETMVKVTKGQEVIAAPHITSVVGDQASLSVGNLKIDIDAQIVR